MLFPWRLGSKFLDALWRVFRLPSVPHPTAVLAGHRAPDGHVTDSYGERQVDDWLHKHVPYRHLYKYSLEREGQRISCDWYISEIDLYIEYWGTTGGERSQLPIKHKFYQDNSLRAIDVYEDELQILDRVMPMRIRRVSLRSKWVRSDFIIRAYVKANRQKNLNVRVLVSRTRAYLPQMEKDLALLKQLLQTYDRTKAKKG